MFPMSRDRSHSMPLSKCMLFQMQGIWPYSNGLSTLDTTLKHTCPHIIDRIPTPGITPGQLLDTITRTDTDTADQGCSLIPTDIEVTVIMTPTEAIPGHIIKTGDATIGVLHDAITPVLIIFAVIPHIKDHPHIGVLQLIQKIAVDPDHTLHINQVRKLCINSHPILAELQKNLKKEDIQES